MSGRWSLTYVVILFLCQWPFWLKLMEASVVYTAVSVVLIAFACTVCGNVCLNRICDRLRRRLGTFSSELGTPVGSDSVVIGRAVAEENLRI